MCAARANLYAGRSREAVIGPGRKKGRNLFQKVPTFSDEVAVLFFLGAAPGRKASVGLAADPFEGAFYGGVTLVVELEIFRRVPQVDNKE